MLKKKNREIIIGSNNTGKIREIRDLLPKFYKIFTPDDFNLKSPKENGKSFIENSLIKAKYYSKKSGKICIADDSGLCVDVLNGKPGILSARFSGEGGNDKKNNIKLLELLKNEKNRRAHYYCAIVFITSCDDPQPIIAEGIWQGEILSSPRGKNGFGYDPIFMDFKTDLSAAELDFNLKNKISHRGQALQKLKHKLRILYDK